MRILPFIVLFVFSIVQNALADTNHSHGGRSHSHPLPSQGFQHRHRGGEIGEKTGENKPRYSSNKKPLSNSTTSHIDLYYDDLFKRVIAPLMIDLIKCHKKPWLKTKPYRGEFEELSDFNLRIEKWKSANSNLTQSCDSTKLKIKQMEGKTYNIRLKLSLERYDIDKKVLPLLIPYGAKPRGLKQIKVNGKYYKLIYDSMLFDGKEFEYRIDLNIAPTEAKILKSRSGYIYANGTATISSLETNYDDDYKYSDNAEKAIESLRGGRNSANIKIGPGIALGRKIVSVYRTVSPTFEILLR